MQALVFTASYSDDLVLDLDSPDLSRKAQAVVDLILSPFRRSADTHVPMMVGSSFCQNHIDVFNFRARWYFLPGA